MLTCERAVAAFFRTHRFAVKVEICERTRIEVGHRVEDGIMSLCHRLDKIAGDTVLTVTDFRLGGGATAGEHVVRHFCRLIRMLLRTVPHVTYVRGMIFPGVSDPQRRETRQRLVAVFEREGAFWRDEDGDRWLVFYRSGGEPVRCCR